MKERIEVEEEDIAKFEDEFFMKSTALDHDLDVFLWKTKALCKSLKGYSDAFELYLGNPNFSEDKELEFVIYGEKEERGFLKKCNQVDGTDLWRAEYKNGFVTYVMTPLLVLYRETNGREYSLS